MFRLVVQLIGRFFFCTLVSELVALYSRQFAIGLNWLVYRLSESYHYNCLICSLFLESNILKLVTFPSF